MLIWTEPAKKDVMNYIDTAKTGTEDTLKKYFLECKRRNYMTSKNKRNNLQALYFL